MNDKQISMEGYEFWDEESRYYKRFFARMYQEDLQAIWKAIAEKAGGDWLDIGSGDGSLLADVVKMTNHNFSLTCLEPSLHAILDLKKNVPVQKVITEPLSKETELDDSYDLITMMHSNYYFPPSQYEEILSKLLSALNKGGKLLILTISEKGDFPRLGDYPYDSKLLAENTYAILKKLGKNTKIIRFHARFDSTEYISGESNDILKELFHYKRFVTHDNSLQHSQDMVLDFKERIKELSKQKGGRYFMDYKDCIVESGPC